MHRLHVKKSRLTFPVVVELGVLNHSSTKEELCEIVFAIGVIIIVKSEE